MYTLASPPCTAHTTSHHVAKSNHNFVRCERYTQEATHFNCKCQRAKQQLAAERENSVLNSFIAEPKLCSIGKCTLAAPQPKENEIEITSYHHSHTRTQQSGLVSFVKFSNFFFFIADYLFTAMSLPY